MTKKKKIQFPVKTKIKKTSEPMRIDAPGYLKDEHAHCPDCGKANLKMCSHYFSNPPGQNLQEIKTDLLLNFEMQCNDCARTFIEINTKEYLKSTDLEGNTPEGSYQDVKICPFCGENKLLFDSAALHFFDDSSFYIKIFCVSCKKHYQEWYEYHFSHLQEWNGIGYYQELHDRLKRKQEHLALQMHRRNQPLHQNQEYQINNQIMEKIRESRLENADLYAETPPRFK